MDSDAVVSKKSSSYPVNDMLDVMQTALNWDPEEKPIVFNQVSQCLECLTSNQKKFIRSNMPYSDRQTVRFAVD
jgi:hypothetical protein